MNDFSYISAFALPAVILLILTVGFLRKVPVYDVFLESAGDGVKTVVRIIPPLVGLIVAVGVFRASGALDVLLYFISPVADFLGVPREAMPLALLRPVSGSASLALVSDIISVHGADSYVGRVVSTMMGSTETIFYTLAVYYGSVGIKKTRYTLPAALVADLTSIIIAAWICAMIFGRT